MKNNWKTLSFVLGALCTWQAWRGCHASTPTPTVETTACHEAEPTRSTPSRERERHRDEEDVTDDAPPSNPVVFGMRVPPWAKALMPAPGENLRAYRDRMIPLAQMAIAPQRARMQRSVEEFSKVAQLDDTQKAALSANVDETATAIEDRLFNAALSGELSSSTFKPMTGVKVARDLLNIVDEGNSKFVGSLRDDQRAALATHPFDFADYLVFHTRWEDAISGL